MKKNLLVKCVCLFFVIILGVCLIIGCNSNTKFSSSKLANYDISIDFDNALKTLNCSMKVSYTNVYDSILSELKFHLYPNAFKEQNCANKPVSDYNFEKAYPNGFDAGYIDISNVKNNGNNVNYEIGSEDNTILTVYLDEELYPNDFTELLIDFTTKIPNCLQRFGYADNTINVGNFYPVLCVFENGEYVVDGYHYNGDPFYSDIANYKVNITCDNSLKLASTGKIIAQNAKNSNVIYDIEANNVRDFAFVLSDKFEIISHNMNNLQVNYLFYNDDNSQDTLLLFCDTMMTFNNLIGEYPYDAITVVQCNFLHGGMEYPNLALISDSVVNEFDFKNVVVHELAHQWFYNIIGNDEYSEAWLDEGLTEYVTLMFFNLNQQYEISYQDCINSRLSSYLLFMDIYKEVYGSVDTSMNRRLCDYQSEAEYTYMIYVKSVLMYDSLRELIGDGAFCLGLKNYYENNKFKIAKADNLIKSFQSVTTLDIKSFFESWINGKVVIENIS